MWQHYPTTISSFSPLAYFGDSTKLQVRPLLRVLRFFLNRDFDWTYAAVRSQLCARNRRPRRAIWHEITGRPRPASVDVLGMPQSILAHRSRSEAGDEAEATMIATGLCPFSSMSAYFFGAARSGWLVYVNNTGRVQFRIAAKTRYVATPAGGAMQSALDSFGRHVRRHYSQSVCERRSSAEVGRAGAGYQS